MTRYFRPIPHFDPAVLPDSLALAGGICRFSQVEVLARGRAPEIIAAHELDAGIRARLCAPRPDFAGLAMDRPQIMAILNVTPDSFSDGGRYHEIDAALVRARALQGVADLIDIGGESTRPGAQEVAVADEVARVAPVIAALRGAGIETPVSVDTRKAGVARAALEAGAQIVNDVSALEFDPEMAAQVAASGAPVILMHSLGDPQNMQDDPRYDAVLLDVYDALAARIEAALAAGIARDRIAIDPGIGFGKTLEHNLALIRRLSLFHGLGAPILLGVSRKRMIGAIAGESRPEQRMPGSLALALAGVAQGVQMLRVHDAAETRQALRLWMASTGGGLTW